MTTDDLPGCRACGARLDLTLFDPGPSPADGPGAAASALPVRVCRACWLCQTDPRAAGTAEIVRAPSARPALGGWQAHCRRFAVRMMADLHLGPRSLVAGIGAGAGDFLQYFGGVGVPVLDLGAAGPGGPMWDAARALALRDAGCRPDLVFTLDALAEAGEIADFVRALALLTQGEAVCSIEVPHLLALIEEVQFDRLCASQPVYLSLIALAPILARAGLRVFDARTLPERSGSLRVSACRAEAGHTERPSVVGVIAREQAVGLARAETYLGFAGRAGAARDRLVDFLASAHHGRKTVVAFGPPARIGALVRFCAGAADMIAYGVDDLPAGQRTTVPGTAITVFDPEELRRRRPDFVLILSGETRAEVMGEFADLRRRGTRFVTALPDVSVTA